MVSINKKRIPWFLYLPFALVGYMCNSNTGLYQDDARASMLVGKWFSEKSYNPYLRQYEYHSDPAYQDSVVFYPDHTYSHRTWGKGRWELLEKPIPYESDTSATFIGSMDDRFDIVELKSRSLQLRVLGRHGTDIYYFRKVD